ncbi:MAG: sugar transferase [Anaeromicrobium sp.]|jgi:exopolysaccharide biosynthesis polyprenyl glycosylphosphotransferase|uniref:sugar transferase n=1 Tax=Anaeromicrobium sp. TaxID=1929132 RepID=UPI00260052BD|nr:sugar transferase [Anaeromicrobium sp.]MCT4593951.1 sugar transferase [Anaeromicrobium sp.]
MFIKNLFDKIMSLIILLILSPVLIVIGVLIKLDSKGPVFFIQERVGLNEKLFNVYKFRTMVTNAYEISGYYTEENDPRITKIGKLLRKTSLDELPQLINILKGDMSIIGPRPTLEYQVKEYNDFQRQRLKMKPGVTGWAQVNGRNSISWPNRIEYDVEYVNNYSFMFDIKILLKTIRVVLKRDGIYGEEENFKIR